MLPACDMNYDWPSLGMALGSSAGAADLPILPWYRSVTPISLAPPARSTKDALCLLANDVLAEKSTTLDGLSVVTDFLRPVLPRDGTLLAAKSKGLNPDPWG